MSCSLVQLLQLNGSFEMLLLNRFTQFKAHFWPYSLTSPFDVFFLSVKVLSIVTTLYRGDGYNSGLYNSGKGIKTEIIPDYDFADDNSGLKI